MPGRLTCFGFAVCSRLLSRLARYALSSFLASCLEFDCVGRRFSRAQRSVLALLQRAQLRSSAMTTTYARGEWDPHHPPVRHWGADLEGRNCLLKISFAQHVALKMWQRKLVAPPLGPLGRMKPAGFRLVVEREPDNTSACKSGASICRALASAGPHSYIGPASLLADVRWSWTNSQTKAAAHTEQAVSRTV